MTITQAESGLTESQYNSVEEATNDFTSSIVLRKFGPVWSEHDTLSDVDKLYTFDAIYCDGYLVRAYYSESGLVVEKLDSESSGDESWASISNTVTDINIEHPTSLAVNGSEIHLFYVGTDYKIKLITCNDVASGSFGSSSDVTDAIPTIELIAAPSHDVVHYTYLTEKTNRHLVRVELDGTWSETESDIYWPFHFDSMDAVVFGDEELLLFAASMSPIIGTRAVAANVSRYAQEVDAMVMFRYANGRWICDADQYY